MPLPNPLKIPGKRLSLIDDPLRNEPNRLKDTYGELKDAPLSWDLRRNSILGVIGLKPATRLCQNMIMQLSAMHSYHDVKIAILCEEDQASHWAWARWLPHVFPDADRRLRMVAAGRQEAQHVLAHIDELLMQRLDKEREADAEPDREHQPLPHYVIFCQDIAMLERHPIMRRLLMGGHGITLVMIASSMDKLPKECELIANTYPDGMGIYSAAGEAKPVALEFADIDLAEAYARSIAPVRVHDMVEVAGIPQLVTFLDVYGVRRTEDLDVWRFWHENHAYEGIRATVGLQAASQPFVLDISEHVHGPHGLVAGTTGAGKSVMLQTYILALALNYHPSQVQFVLIDYKGGGMSNDFANLPHVAGRIDNLQTNRLIFRALASIRGEIHRRQEIFSKVGVTNIDDYMRFFHNDPNEETLAHIIIVVDEFAELKKEQPDFMRELVTASRVGRSMGMHLILATQKPANSVDDEIWSNTKFRICLRVASQIGRAHV